MIAIDVKGTPAKGFTFSVSKDGKPVRSIAAPKLEGIADLVPRALTKFPADMRQLVERAATLIDGLNPAYLPLRLTAGT